MLEMKKCMFCDTPFEPESDNDNTCSKHKQDAIYTDFFKGELEHLKQNTEKFPELRLFNGTEFLKKEFKRDYYLYPILPEACIVLLAGEAGCGKSMFCMAVADALSKGQNFGPWENRVGSVKTLYIDGEMHPVDFQERIKQFDIDTNFHTYSVSADYYHNNRPFIIDLSVEAFRNLITFEARKNDIKFIVIDNLASLTAGTRENTKEGWDPINQWLLKLRHMGISIFVVHHMSKGKDQRGTSARMDNVDSTLYIKKPPHYSASDGARFILDFKKHRGKIDSDSKELVKNRQLWYKQNGQGEWYWDFGSGMLGNKELLIDIVESGLSLQKIGEKHGLTQPTTSRRKKDFIEKGYINKKNGKLEYTDKGKEFINQTD